MSGLRSLAFLSAAAMLSTELAILAQHSDVALPHFAIQVPAVAFAEPHTPKVRILLAQSPSRFAARPTVSLPHIDQDDQGASKIEPDDIAEHLREIIPTELLGYFDLYLYVSKAAAGPWAQHMVVFHKEQDGRFVYEDDFPVSTGREHWEKYFTSTPEGLFELDPGRFDRVHFSRRWHIAPMPWAMFLNYVIRGNPTGVAIHSAVGHEADLGRRASGGCVRLPPEKAQSLFQRIQETEAGRVPAFAMDATGVTTDKEGRMARDSDGAPILQDGYRVLLVIEDYPGAPVAVATLS